MMSKDSEIINVRNNIGWAYSDFKWLTAKEAELANKQRDDLLKSLKKKTRDSFLQSKIHIGELSPGCSICGNGDWSCLFINGRCTKNCFFCPQDRKITEERPPQAELSIDDPKEYAAHLEKFHFKGVGFSGGEPFLVFDKLLRFIEEIRKRFGKSMYLWMYTNGDLVTRDKLGKLKKAGLDEIRFNITQNHYDLRPVKLAVSIIGTVTVEIPMIPEDYEIVQALLVKMRKIGVKYLNIHQLMATHNNYKSFINRRYTCTHTIPIAIVESEMAALRLLDYAADKKIGLPINYCTHMYKNRFQGKGARARYADSVQRDFEGLTDAKYIRTLSVQDSLANIRKLADLLRKRSRPEMWEVRDAKTELFVHHSLLKHIDFNKYSLTISYFESQLNIGPDTGGEGGKAVRLSTGKEVLIKKVFRAQQKFSNRLIVDAFQGIYIKNEDWSRALSYLYKNYDLRKKDGLSELKRDIDLLFTLKDYERMPVGFPELY